MARPDRASHHHRTYCYAKTAATSNVYWGFSCWQ